jgi:glycine/D-amino acid oxidase-like deaminating enzyme
VRLWRDGWSGCYDRAMDARADVVVVGAGVVGSSVAHALCAGGAGRVALVDPRGPAGGMSGRSFRQVRRHHTNDVIVRLAERGFALIDAWDEAVGVGDPGYVRLGYLLLVEDSEAEPCRRNVELGRRYGVETEFLSPDRIAEVEPLVRADGLAGAAYEPGGGVVDPVKMCLAWVAASLGRGLEPRFGDVVTGIDASAGRVTGVRTPAGPIAAPVVVLATGPWAGPLLAPLGVDPELTLVPLDVATLRQPSGGPLLRTAVTDSSAGLVLRADRGPVFQAVAYQGERTVTTPDDVPGAHDYERAVRAALRRRVPSVADAAWEGAVTGVYDATPDWHPLLGWSPDVEGLYLAIGWSGYGLKLAPAAGEVVAADVLGIPQIVDASELRPDRFALGRPLPLAYGPGARA